MCKYGDAQSGTLPCRRLCTSRLRQGESNYPKVTEKLRDPQSCPKVAPELSNSCPRNLEFAQAWSNMWPEFANSWRPILAKSGQLWRCLVGLGQIGTKFGNFGPNFRLSAVLLSKLIPQVDGTPFRRNRRRADSWRLAVSFGRRALLERDSGSGSDGAEGQPLAKL